jgi:hypothetical protein
MYNAMVRIWDVFYAYKRPRSSFCPATAVGTAGEGSGDSSALRFCLVFLQIAYIVMGVYLLGVCTAGLWGAVQHQRGARNTSKKVLNSQRCCKNRSYCTAAGRSCCLVRQQALAGSSRARLAIASAACLGIVKHCTVTLDTVLTCLC